MIHKFEGILKKIEDKNATYIDIPFDVEKEFGAKRVKVKAKMGYLIQVKESIING